MAGSAVVTTTIRLQGEDRASAEINKAKQAIDHTAKSLEDAASKSDVLQGSFQKAFSGDVLGAAKDLSGLMGNGTGLAGTLGLAAVGAGAVAVAVAGITVEAAKWSMALEKTRAAAEHALGPDALQRIEAVAGAAGGATEDYAKLASRLKLMGIDAHITAEQLAELQDRADDVGFEGADALTAFGDAIETGKTKALKAVGVYVDADEAVKKYSKSHLISVDAMTMADKQSAILAATLENLDEKMAKTSSTASRTDDAFDQMGRSWSHLKFELSAGATGPLADMVEGLASVTDGSIRWAKVLVALADIGLRPIISLIKVEIDAFMGLAAAADAVLHRNFAGAANIAKQVGKDIKTAIVDDNDNAVKRLGAALDDAMNPKAGARVPKVLDIKGRADEQGYEPDGPSPEVLEKERYRRIEKANKDVEQGHAKALAAGKKHAEELKKIAEQEFKNAEHWADMRVKNEEADLAVLNKIREDSDKKVHDINAKRVTDPAQRALQRMYDLEVQRVKDLDKIRDSVFAHEKARKAAELAVNRAYQAEKVAIEREEVDENDKATKTKISNGIQIAEATKGFLGEMGISKRWMAGIDAAIQTADAIASAASQDYVGAVQHGLAAVAYAAAAFGGGGSSGSSSGGGGAYAPAAALAGSSSTTGTGHTVHIHVQGFVHGTAQEVAKGMNSTLKTLGNTGFAGARGA